MTDTDTFSRVNQGFPQSSLAAPWPHMVLKIFVGWKISEKGGSPQWNQGFLFFQSFKIWLQTTDHNKIHVKHHLRNPTIFHRKNHGVKSHHQRIIIHLRMLRAWRWHTAARLDPFLSWAQQLLHFFSLMNVLFVGTSMVILQFAQMVFITFEVTQYHESFLEFAGTQRCCMFVHQCNVSIDNPFWHNLSGQSYFRLSISSSYPFVLFE